MFSTKKINFSTLVANWVKMVTEGRQNGNDVGQNRANGCKICFSLESIFLKIVGHSVLFFITVGKTAKHIQENFGVFSKLAGVPFCFSLHFVIDFACRVRPTRERVCPRSAGSREGNNCPWSREPILNNGNADGTHIWARWRDGRRQLDIYVHISV